MLLEIRTHMKRCLSLLPTSFDTNLIKACIDSGQDPSTFKVRIYRCSAKSNPIVDFEADSMGVAIGNRTSPRRSTIEEVQNKLRKLADNYTALQGFLVFNAIGGGPGSGLHSLLLECLSVDYGKKFNIMFTIYSSPVIMLSSYDPVISAGNAYHEQLSVPEITNAVFEHSKGMEEVEFSEATEDLPALEKDYEQVGNAGVDDEENGEEY
ncbi:Tubulin alpha-2 chain [Capsicum chinense]|nr:Tubulin alpha-2 chain [Capsicum chinense]